VKLWKMCFTKSCKQPPEATTEESPGSLPGGKSKTTPFNQRPPPLFRSLSATVIDNVCSPFPGFLRRPDVHSLVSEPKGRRNTRQQISLLRNSFSIPFTSSPIVIIQSLQAVVYPSNPPRHSTFLDHGQHHHSLCCYPSPHVDAMSY
jgi:hypothetical protein